MRDIFSPEEHEAGWISAHHLFQHLKTGGVLEPLPFTTLTLGPSEQVYADCLLEYARYYGTDVYYEQRSMFAMGSPLFVLGAHAVNAAGNAAARHRAELQASPQWREISITRAVLTSSRLLVSRQGRWLSFPSGSVMEFLPTPEIYWLVLSYPDCAPVRLRGPAVPWLSVAYASLLYQSDKLVDLPRFAAFAAAADRLPAAGPPSPDLPDA